MNSRRRCAALPVHGPRGRGKASDTLLSRYPQKSIRPNLQVVVLARPDIASMIRLKPLQQLRDLDPSSPQFHEQLNSCLRGSEYRNAVLNLQGEDLSWVVEYLHNVSLQIASPLRAQHRRRFSSVFPIIQTPRSGNACTNSKRYVVLRRCYQSCVRCQAFFLKMAFRPLLDACMGGPLMAQGYGFNV